MAFDPETLFLDIVEKRIPADIVYEDDRVVAFRDIQPQAPTHILIVPRRHIRRLSDLSAEDAALAGHMLLVANRLAEQEGIAAEGYRVLFNCGEAAGQSIWHLHLHLMGGRPLGWPPG